jgi:transmembrane sensor
MTPDSVSTIDLARLSRYLDGTASPEERVAVEAWIGDDPARRAAVQALHAAWTDDAGRLDAPYDAEAALVRLTADLDQPRPPAIGAALRRQGRWAQAGWAAAILVAVGMGSTWWLSSRAPATQRSAQAPAMREYATARGRRAVFRLIDGSEITLNTDTRLRVPLDFGAARRDVFLDGEAYFNVVHDSTRPFVVHTSQSSVRDVGTRFGVRAYPDGGTERIAVAEGAVAVRSGSNPSGDKPIRAGQVAALAHGQLRVLAGADVRQELAWTEGRVVLASVPLREAALRLGRWYDLDIRIVDPVLAERPVSGSYSDEPVTEVLTLITSAIGARYELRGRLVTISAADTAP